MLHVETRLVLFTVIVAKGLSENLTQTLLGRTNSSIRPISSPNDQIQVHLMGALYQIVDVDQRNNLATINAFFDMDQYLTWEPEEYQGTRETYLPSKSAWVPELYLYHSIMGSTPLHLHESAVQVDFSGKVRTFVPFTARALCPINVKYFPFDMQTCNFTFGSWSYRLENVEFFVESRSVFLQDFYDNQEWILLDCVLQKADIKYSTNFSNESYSAVVMTIQMERQSFYYIFNLVIPTTLVSVVAIVGFHAPGSSAPRRETKFRLGIMTLLSMGVMLLMVVDQMPKFSLASTPGQRGSFSDVPLLGIFYIFLISTISLGTCTTSIFVFMERYAFEHPEPKAVPRWLRWLSRDTRKQLHRKNCQVPPHTPIKTMSGLAEEHNSVQLGLADDSRADSARVVRFSSKKASNHLESPSSSETSTLATCRAYSAATSNDEGDTLRILLERIADTAVLIARRILVLQERLEPLYTLWSGDPKFAMGKSKHMSFSRRQSAAVMGAPVLTPHWHRVIQRLELISLFVYLFGIVMMLCLLFRPGWWY